MTAQEEYMAWLAAFSRDYAQMAMYKEMVEQGECLPKQEYARTLMRLSFSKKKLLEKKQILGLQDGLAFLENNKFKGFELRDGELIGDIRYASQIVRPWFYDYPEKSNNSYKFEVANIIIALAEKKRDGS